MSPFRQAMNEYLELRRSLGFKLVEVGKTLENFVNFLEELGSPVLTIALAISWAKQNLEAPPAQWTYRLSVARRFAQYVTAIDPRTEIPPLGLLPHRYIRKNPHIYSQQEIARLMEAARQLRVLNGLGPETGLRPWTISTVIGLLTVTGLRFSEVINLKSNDVDFTNAVLTVHRTKFGKSRIVPLHETTVEVLRQYAYMRDRVHPVPRSPNFFVRQRGRPMNTWSLHGEFILLSRRTGLRGVADSRGPRIHDFRHSFAVNTMVRWYEAGLDVERQTPLLSTFLGHTHVADTYWYLSATPRLLGLAAARLEEPHLGRKK